MGSDKKVDGSGGKWAIVTDHPWLPPLVEQIARARAWGVDEERLGKDDVSPLFIDDARKVKVTRGMSWPKHLPVRADFIKRMNTLQYHGNEVFFATPLCVGFTAKHAENTIKSLWGAGLKVYIHTVADNGSALYKDGDDLSFLLGTIAHAANNAHQRAFMRGRRAKSK